jgi:mannose-6-phosphate isomerase-like protein (cupin superfamily)
MNINIKVTFILLGLIWITCLGFADPQDHSAAQHSVIVTDSVSKPEILVRALPSVDTSYVSMLKSPTSQKLRSGFVCLKPGISGEEHSTEGYEEMIVFLNGKGELHSTDKTLPIGQGSIAYVPPHSTHFLKNTGTETLRYVYIVTKVEQ